MSAEPTAAPLLDVATEPADNETKESPHPPAPPLPESLQLLTPGEVATALRISRARVYFWLSAGKLRSVRVGRFPRVTQEELRRFINLGDANPIDNAIVSKDA